MILLHAIQLADPGFPVGGVLTLQGVATYDFVKFFKNCINRENIGPWGEACLECPLDPPLPTCNLLLRLILFF